MPFDFPTLFAVTLFVSAVAGCLLLFAWTQNREVVALALWGVGFLLSSAAMGLFASRGAIPDLWSIVMAHMIWLAAHGIMWTAARSFEGRRTPLGLTFAGAGIWLLACQFASFYESPKARMILTCAIMGSYVMLCAAEIWRARERELMSRWPTIVLLVLHASLFLGRIPFVDVLPFPGGLRPPSPHWFPIGVFEMLFHTICMAVLLVNMAKERAELHQRQASLVDPLTGVANRRAFFERGDRLLARAKAEQRASALLVFDLDRFKEINDSFGHQFGDLVLVHFCEVVKRNLRPGHLFGRFGGEEFGCLLPGASLAEALRLAERIRFAFGARALNSGSAPVIATVSVGAAVSGELDRDLDQLFASADRALYRAKAKGRNRIESGGAPLVLVEPVRRDSIGSNPADPAPVNATGH